ncbi:polysialyltransferase family glycosyltransferase [Shewanella algae]|uniref:polysialyltransferase family glycosyltransferase n=1 Tax=Shewanella algae TaxID=38313 RepID=UPI001AACF8AF|nr:hypothetical protein [Shewanella algae]MBO2700058.1 hypothetical protein [Shewanella algae]
MIDVGLMKKILVAKKITTTWQLTNVLSIFNSGEYSALYIYTGTYWGKYVIPDWIVNYISQDPRIRVYTSEKFVASKYRNCVIISVNLPCYKSALLNDNIVIEDGFGFYNSFYRKINLTIKHRGIFRASLLFFLLLCSRPLKYIFSGKIDYQTMFDNQLKLNNQVCSRLKKEIEKQADYFNVVHFKDSDVLFCGMPLVENGTLSKENYLSLLEYLQQYFKNAGKKLYYKPHPSESLDKFIGTMFSIIESEANVEHIVSKSPFIEVYSLYSTSLININAIFGIKTYGIKSFGGQFIVPELSDMQNALLDKYSNVINIDF